MSDVGLVGCKAIQSATVGKRMVKGDVLEAESGLAGALLLMRS